MKIQEIAIDLLKPYPNNPRKNEKAVAPVAASIKEFGFKVPLVIDKNNVVVCGHTRLLAAKRLNLATVPCVIADGLTTEQLNALRLADNKTAEVAEWDFGLLTEELGGIMDIDMAEFGFEGGGLYNTDFFNSMRDDEFVSFNDDLHEFAVTLLFPVSRKDDIEKYIKAHGKKPLVDFIVSKIAGDT